MSAPTFISGEVLTASKLNDLSDMVTPGTWATLNSTYGAKYRRIGDLVEVRMSNYVSAGQSMTGTAISLGQLPTGYRPSDTAQTAVWAHKSNSSGTACLRLAVDSSGNATLNIWSANGTYDQYGGTLVYTVN